MVVQYLITDEAGWSINAEDFEDDLMELYPDAFLGDSREMRRLTVKVYGVKEDDVMLGRIDLYCESVETKVTISGEEAERLNLELTSRIPYNWERV